MFLQDFLVFCTKTAPSALHCTLALRTFLSLLLSAGLASVAPGPHVEGRVDGEQPRHTQQLSNAVSDLRPLADPVGDTFSVEGHQLLAVDIRHQVVGAHLLYNMALTRTFLRHYNDVIEGPVGAAVQGKPDDLGSPGRRLKTPGGREHLAAKILLN